MRPLLPVRGHPGPELRNELPGRVLDADSPVNFKPDGHTVKDYDERFQLEDEGLIDPEKRFLWSMLEDGGVNYRLF